MEGVGPVLVHMWLNTMPFVTLFLKMHFNSFRERRFYAFFFLLRQVAFWKSVTMDILVFTFLKCIMKSRFFLLLPFCAILRLSEKLQRLFEKRYDTFWNGVIMPLFAL